MEQDERLIKVILCVCVHKASVFVSNLWVFPFFVGTCKLWSQAIHVQVCAVSLPIFIQHSAAVHHEHLEKARLRHKHAMARVRMEKVLDISYCCNVVQTYARFCKWHGFYKSGQVFGSIYSPYNFLWSRTKLRCWSSWRLWKGKIELTDRRCLVPCQWVRMHCAYLVYQSITKLLCRKL